MISVCIPAYNSARTVIEALISIHVQSVHGLEVIIVDDASTDATAEAVNSWIKENIGSNRNESAKRNSCRIVTLEYNSGPAAARNRGIAEAKGEWIAFLDADDAWLPDKLEIQLEYLKQNPDVAMVCGGVAAYGSEGVKECGDKCKAHGAEREETADKRRWTQIEAEEILGRSASNTSSGFKFQVSNFRRVHIDEFVAGNPVATSTVLVRKDVLSAVGGFDEQFRGPEDYDLWMRIAASHSIALCSLPLARYRETVGSLSMDDRKFLPMVLRVLEKAFGSDGVFSVRKELFSTAVSSQYWNASWMAFRRGARFTAIRYWLVSCLENARAEKKVERKWVSLFFRYLFGTSQIV